MNNNTKCHEYRRRNISQAEATSHFVLETAGSIQQNRAGEAAFGLGVGKQGIKILLHSSGGQSPGVECDAGRPPLT